MAVGNVLLLVDCGGDFYLSEDLNRAFQNINSPGFRENGAGRYPCNAQCTWRLRVLTDETLSLCIQLRVVSLDLQFSYGCNFDYLLVYACYAIVSKDNCTVTGKVEVFNIMFKRM